MIAFSYFLRQPKGFKANKTHKVQIQTWAVILAPVNKHFITAKMFQKVSPFQEMFQVQIQPFQNTFLKRGTHLKNLLSLETLSSEEKTRFKYGRPLI